jgi:hypothetical protein
MYVDDDDDDDQYEESGIQRNRLKRVGSLGGSKEIRMECEELICRAFGVRNRVDWLAEESKKRSDLQLKKP